MRELQFTIFSLLLSIRCVDIYLTSFSIWILWTFESANNFPMITHEIVFCTLICLLLCVAIILIGLSASIEKEEKEAPRLQQIFMNSFYGPSH